jgi:hypothetical protein
MAVLLALALVWSSLHACGTSRTECDCAEAAARVRVPAESAAAVAQVSLAGEACAGVQPTCEQQTTVGCAAYRFQASAAGSCVVSVTFADRGMFTATVKFSSTTCCAGFYPDPPSAGDIDVIPPEGDGGAE